MVLLRYKSKIDKPRTGHRDIRGCPGRGFWLGLSRRLPDDLDVGRLVNRGVAARPEHDCADVSFTPVGDPDQEEAVAPTGALGLVVHRHREVVEAELRRHLEDDLDLRIAVGEAPGGEAQGGNVCTPSGSCVACHLVGEVAHSCSSFEMNFTVNYLNIDRRKNQYLLLGDYPLTSCNYCNILLDSYEIHHPTVQR